ncbi:MAG: sugar phosphate nucleotidyltransferase [Candidatus Altiarchaeota archaeon]
MNRERLTITLRDDILDGVDKLVDGIKIRNRSHAIEVLLAKILAGGRIKKALILAGGEGSRMRPFTYEMPKGLIPVQGKPLLQHILELLRKSELRDVIISIGYMGEKIKEYFGNGSKFGLNISYVEEKEPLGTAGCLRLAKEHLKEPFLMFNGDVIANINLPDMVSFHEENNAIATIALTPVEDPSRYGMAHLRGPKILSFEEKPKKKKGEPQLVNAGIYILNPEVIDYLPNGKSMMETDLFPKLAKEGKLFGYPFEGQWFDTGTPQAYERAIKKWKPLP